MRYLNIVVSILLITTISILCMSCGSKYDSLTTEAEYVAQIESLSAVDSPLYVTFESLDEMIETTHANLIIRCTVSKRNDCIVYDPWGICDEDDLNGNTRISSTAQRCIVTPYTLNIKECYLGNLAIGDAITFYAPYGVINGYSYRKSQAPILSVGAECILVLRAEEINGEIVYNLSYTPDSIYTIENVIQSKNISAETGDDSLFSKYQDNVSALESDIRALISDNNYSTVVEVFSTSGK